MAHGELWVEADRACTTSGGEYRLDAYAPSAENPAEVIRAEQKVGLVSEELALAAVEKLSGMPEVSAYALRRLCFLPRHRQKVPAKMRDYESFQVERVRTGVFAAPDATPRRIYLTTAIKYRGANGVTAAKVPGKSGEVLRPVQLLPRAEYDTPQYGFAICARAVGEGVLYVALTPGDEIFYPNGRRVTFGQ